MHVYVLLSTRAAAHRGRCGGDFYCDDNSVCGVHCDEIDLLEANRHAIRVTAHGANVAAGLGGPQFRPDGHWVGVSLGIDSCGASPLQQQFAEVME